ncbi:MAG: rod shape-determining protein MreD [Actinomycetota bacterium]|nr:rod shape-determining protein MreD [Actinomycetota bacterium]
MTRAKVGAVVLVAIIVQRVFLDGVHLGGSHLDLMLLLPIAAGVAAGSETGAVVGFVAGAVADLFLPTPFGLSALTFSLLGFAVGSVQEGLLRAAWWITPVTAFVSSAVGVVLFALIGAVVGQAHFVRPALLGIAFVVALGNAALALPVVRVVTWALARSGPAAAYAR